MTLLFKWMASAAFILSALATTTGCEQVQQQPIGLQNPNHLIQNHILPLLSETSRLEFGGEAVDFGRLTRDGRVDFALVTPSLTRMDLLNFDLSSLISPEFDRIEVAGYAIDLPSNISLPEQVENYSIISLRLNKPQYRTFVKSPGTYTFSALRGQFPVRQVIDDFRNQNKSIFDIVNHFQFLGVGQVEAQVNQSMSGQNISVNQHQFTEDTAVTAPPLQKGQMSFALTLSDVNGQLSPVDLKRLQTGTPQKLKVSPLGDAYVLAALVNEGPKGKMPSFDRMSLTLLPLGFATTPDFLPYTGTPEWLEQNLNIHPPELNGNQEAVAVYVSFSEIKKITSGSVDTQEKTVLWESWTEGFTHSISTASLNYSKRPDRSYQFEVLYLVRDTRIQTAGDEMIDHVTHISRNVLEVE